MTVSGASSIITLFAALVLSTVPVKGLAAGTNEQPEYLLSAPAGWHILRRERFHKAWISDPRDPLSPQIYFVISRNIAEPNDRGYASLVNDIRKAAADVPDGMLEAHSRTNIGSCPVIDFRITYTVYQEKARVSMEKLIRAFYSRGDQFMFMSLFRKKDRIRAIAAFDKITKTFRLTGAPPQQDIGRGNRPDIFTRAFRSIRRYWWILIPIALLSGYVVYRDKRKKTG